MKINCKKNKKKIEKKGWWLGLNGEGGGKTKGWAGRGVVVEI